MLDVLRITNFAIIDQLEVEFAAGLTVITGETGAGKSIMMGALRLLLGERATAEVVRSGSKKASVEGHFRIRNEVISKWLAANGFEPEDEADGLFLRREVLSEGASRSYINGNASTVAQLRELGSFLVDMHGQNDHGRLYSQDVQLEILDAFGRHDGELKEYEEAWGKWREARARYEALSADQGDALREKDFLQFQVDEISGAGLRIGEDAELEVERKRLGSAERILEICSGASDVLYEGDRTENPVGTQLASVTKLLAELAQLDPGRADMAKEADALKFAVEDLSEKLRDYSADLAVDPGRLDEVESRLELIKTLKRKYGATVEDVISAGEALASRLNDIVNHDAALAEAEVRVKSAEIAVLAAGKILTEAREKTSRALEKQAQENMRELELPKAEFKVSLEGLAQDADSGVRFVQSGLEKCEFLVSLNAGEPPKPLRKVASGGEVSRIMLALKSVVADRDDISTLVFDEIDTGISGKAAARVGEKLEKLGENHQVLCITHLPQVAARGATHLVVEKVVVKDRTSTEIRPVAGEERTLALARMLSGESVDESTVKFAEQLLVKGR